MNSIKEHITLFILYLASTNFYFAMWYMGSEGEAALWAFGRLTFSELLINANVAALFTFGALMVSSRYVNQAYPKYFRSYELFTVANWLLTGSIFVTCLTGAISISTTYVQASQYLWSLSFLSLGVYHFAVLLLFVVLINISKRLGGLTKAFAYFIKPLNAPSQLEKGFMFLDLNTSTSIAEKLGNQHYSQFIRKCFHLLDQVLDRYAGIEVYQYVGDEAILHWNFNDPVTCQKAIDLFYDYKRLLSRYANHFEMMFQTSPTFKAALHGGPVVKSEFGSKAIHTAFHGDVLNTASRILGSCHQHQTDILISESYFRQIDLSNGLRAYQQIDDIALDGKAQKVTLFKPLIVDEQLVKDLL